MQISKAENALLKEIRDLKFGELLSQCVPAQEPTIRMDCPHPNELHLIRILREYQEVELIKVQDGLPMYVMIQQQGKFGPVRRRIRCVPD